MLFAVEGLLEQARELAKIVDMGDNELVEAAASRIYDHYASGLYANPLKFWLGSCGRGDGEVVVCCRRKPTKEQKDQCIHLADGVPVRFIVTGVMRAN